MTSRVFEKRHEVDRAVLSVMGAAVLVWLNMILYGLYCYLRKRSHVCVFRVSSKVYSILVVFLFDIFDLASSVSESICEAPKIRGWTGLKKKTYRVYHSSWRSKHLFDIRPELVYNFWSFACFKVDRAGCVKKSHAQKADVSHSSERGLGRSCPSTNLGSIEKSYSVCLYSLRVASCKWFNKTKRL